MSGVKRQVDRLGRIVIPISYRKYLNLNENSSVNISLENDSIIITADTEPRGSTSSQARRLPHLSTG